MYRRLLTYMYLPKDINVTNIDSAADGWYIGYLSRGFERGSYKVFISLKIPRKGAEFLDTGKGLDYYRRLVKWL